jgi:hypothetical protein
MEQKRYTAEQKRWVIEQMSPPLNRTVVELARQSGITAVTLRTWRNEAIAAGELSRGDGRKWSSAQKFQAVLETAPLSAQEVSEYCRRKGIHVDQLRQWRAACEQANGTGVAGAARPPGGKELERELRRKEAALAEAAALLMLRKKADAIWGTEEEE